VQVTSVPAQVPSSALQASSTVQGLPSLHSPACGVRTQPTVGSQLSTVQGLSSSQLMSVPPPQVPLSQVCPTLHKSPVAQGPATGVCGQLPSPLQSPISEVHGLLSTQLSPLTGSHVRVPSLSASVQRSPVEQAFPSLQGSPSGRFEKTHPVLASHESIVHGLLSLHVTAVPVQAPAAQLSEDVHALPSLHEPEFKGVVSQPVAGSQLSVVHWLLSLHTFAWPVHVEPEQLAPVMHSLPGLQAPVVLVCAQVPALQESLVQGLSSSQSVHAPPLLPQLSTAFR
jgi:hypothetical protein